MNMLIKLECPFCNADHHVRVSKAQWVAWKRGMNIQDAMPNLKRGAREQLISMLCPECQLNVFKPIEDDERSKLGGLPDGY